MNKVVTIVVVSNGKWHPIDDVNVVTTSISNQKSTDLSKNAVFVGEQPENLMGPTQMQMIR